MVIRMVKHFPLTGDLTIKLKLCLHMWVRGQSRKHYGSDISVFTYSYRDTKMIEATKLLPGVGEVLTFKHVKTLVSM